MNIDGDVSLNAAEDVKYWNPHSFRLDDGQGWKVDFSDEVVVTLKTSWGDAGHVATGMWWTKGFKQGEKITVYSCEIRVDFDIYIEKFNYTGTGEWLRVALACAIQRGEGSVVYTEMDVLDTPNTQRHPRGNIRQGGDMIFQGGDVVEFKIDEIPLKTWRHYSVDLNTYIDRAWDVRDGDRLESVYLVIEFEDNPVDVELRIDNLWIYKTTL